MTSAPSIQSKKLLALKPNSTGTPIVFTPDLGGNVLYCRELVRHLPDGIAPYALPLTATMLDDEETVSMESLAQDFADILTETWPEGPLHIAGFSFAGLLAFETARALNERGRNVSHIWLFDTRVHRLNLRVEVLRRPIREFMSALRFLHRKTINAVRGETNVLMSFRCLGVNLNTRPKAYWPIIRKLHGALARYRPRPSSDSPTTLFQVDGGDNWRRSPYSLGWIRMTKGTVRVEVVAGKHLTLLADTTIASGIAAFMAPDILQQSEQ